MSSSLGFFILLLSLEQPAGEGKLKERLAAKEGNQALLKKKNRC